MYSIERSPPRNVETKWIQNCFDYMIIETLSYMKEFQEAVDYRTQCHIAFHYLKNFGWSVNKISRLFGIDHKALEKQLSLPIELNPNGRPQLLNQEEINTLLLQIDIYHRECLCPTLYDIQQFIISSFKKVISIDTLRNYILSQDRFKIINGIPQDENRVAVNPEDIEKYYDNLSQVVSSCPASLVFNMDEAGQDEYIDTHSMRVVVPFSYTNCSINVPVRRSCKRSTLVHCICADGTYLKPLVIVPRKTLDNVILKRLCCNNVMIKFQEKGFTNTELMKVWLTEIFLPFIKQKWEIENKRSGFTGDAVLIMDGMSAHAAALRDINLADYHLSIIYLVPHSSHLTQPLDLVIFSIQKLYTNQRKIGLKLSNQADKIRSIIKGLQQASTSENIISAFESSGIFHSYPNTNDINFNDYIPKCVVVKENSRYYKNEGVQLSIKNCRINF